ncbi:MAG TPA: hypothetical protein V6C97_28065 [Oculatellaceae cyanobacterium]
MRSSNLRQSLISVLIFTYVYLSALWLSPPSDTRTALLGSGKNFINYAGLWQNYTLFAPPKGFNGHIEVIAKSDGGTTTSWRLSHPRNLTWIEQQRLDRWRKLTEDTIYWKANSALCPDFASYVAQTMTPSGSKNTNVKLLRRWTDIHISELDQTKASAQTICFYDGH